MRPKLVMTEIDPSPSSSMVARHGLARAIDAAKAAKAAEAEARAALGRNADMIADAQAKVEATEQVLARHKQHQAVRAADAARAGKKSVPDTVPREARHAADEAGDILTALLAARATLEREHEEKQAVLAPLAKAVADAADIVLASQAERLLAEAAGLQQELERRRVALAFLGEKVAAQAGTRVGPLLGMVGSDAGADPAAVLAWQVLHERIVSLLNRERLPGGLNQFGDETVVMRSYAQPWESARLALMENADAELPAH